MIRQVWANNNGAGASTCVITLPIAVQAGSALIVPVWATNVSGSVSVSDNLGQTYAADIAYSGTTRMALFSKLNTAAGVTSITVTHSAGTPQTIAFVIEDDEVNTSSAFDKGSANAAGASSTTWTGPASGVLTQAAELVLSICSTVTGSGQNYRVTTAGFRDVVSGETVTVSNGHHADAADGDDMFVCFTYVNDTASVQATGTCTSSATATMIATYKITSNVSVTEAPHLSGPPFGGISPLGG